MQFKNIAGKEEFQVYAIAGSHIDDAKKEATVLAYLLDTNVRLFQNGRSFILDKKGGCIEVQESLYNQSR